VSANAIIAWPQTTPPCRQSRSEKGRRRIAPGCQFEILHPWRKDFAEDALRLVDVELAVLLLRLHERSFPFCLWALAGLSQNVPFRKEPAAAAGLKRRALGP